MTKEEILQLSDKTLIEYNCKLCNKHVIKRKKAFKYYPEFLCRTCLREKLGVHEKISKTQKISANKESTKQKRKQTCLKKYGVEYAHQSQKVKEKIKNNMIQNYGSVKNYYKKIREKTKKTCLEKYGVESAGQVEAFKEKRINTMVNKYGYRAPVQNKEILKQIIATKKEKYGEHLEKIVEKTKQTKLQKYNDQNYNNLEKSIKTKIQKWGSLKEYHRHCASQCSKTKNKYTALDGTKLDSSYEIIVWNFCIRNNIQIEKGPTIEYEYNNKKHFTYIDFKIDGLLFECKGKHLLKGCYDYEGVPIKIKLEVYKKNNINIITDNNFFNLSPNSDISNGRKYLKNSLILIDIRLFDDPEFPYSKNKPKCFYDVKVNNHLSIKEAWNDELLRWKMIKNRINYAGGYITNTSIKTAMNICRICKQPSWFSKNYAKQLLQKYAITNIIFDPFAGWGSRALAAKELGYNYIGYDLNEELINWHKSQKNNIQLGDANNIICNEECTIFICPPYEDYENYFENQNIKNTQEDWLDIVIRNTPNAKRAIMVCKKVDRYKKYIKEQKNNNGPFGKNNEYVLVIENLNNWNQQQTA
ncbi:MAG: DNA adenine methylase [Elusimicrobiota bacterium]|jgi:hypothetical protein|nr:DNA adenine methylase [Elusimicrobiota bacterium]